MNILFDNIYDKKINQKSKQQYTILKDVYIGTLKNKEERIEIAKLLDKVIEKK